MERLDPLAESETIVDNGQLMMAGRFADYAAIHLLTTATLARLAELSPDVQFDERRFRPNLVVETSGDQSGFIENCWVGRNLAIGDDVHLPVSDPTPRCTDHNRIPLALLDGENLPCAGVYVFVMKSGTIRKGDEVRLQ